MGNLVFAFAILIAYMYSVAIGMPDDTLKMLLVAAGGVFFGQLGPSSLDKLLPSKKSKKRGGTEE